MEIKYGRGKHPNSQKQLVSNYWLGKKQSEETKQKRSLALLGHKGYWLGKKRPDEYRQQLSRAMKKALSKKRTRDEKDRQVIIDRIRHSVEMKLWREAIFKRDNYTCVFCGDNRGGNLNADHILPFSLFERVRFDLLNGRTLCEDCHNKTETYGNRIKRVLRLMTT